MPRVRVQNWKRSITYHANSVERINSAEDLQRIVSDTQRYPSPVRAKGSHHSTTRCVVAEAGTVCDMSGMNKILKIDKAAKTITLEAGCLLIDAAKALEKEGLQFYANVELGNLTMGSGATGGTKDASYYDDGEWEFGQVCSYCIAMKIVQVDGSILEVTEDSDPTLLAALRTGYGMLGITYEMTYRVKEISAMGVHHEMFTVDRFAQALPQLLERKQSIMLYLFPFLDRVLVEFRYDTDEKLSPGSKTWAIRNYTWKTVWPFVSNVLAYLPWTWLRYKIIDVLNRLTLWFMTYKLKDTNSSPADQIIRYSEMGGFASYTFSIWAFPRDAYPETIKEYFKFCKKYYKENNYRCDMLNVGYHIAQDQSGLFSYTRDWPALTLDPVASGAKGWEGFLVAYNEWCVQHGGRPLFNQTGSLTPLQAMKSFGPQIAQFKALRNTIDPDERFLNEHFRTLFSEVDAAETPDAPPAGG
ncbi:FAD-binding protein [Roseovarius sp. M141]|uniref:FAD-binding protein n=1 Tax=Roseovarius sp. M141 TaxID=2583806 RepID=UPI0020CDA1C8|nr:FAD-binding protein [Roseovarius sp. M141]MCQ0090829.1 FAD-binding protein [Roseovarius sp. M141]